jgi:hypothetical protein
VKAANRHLQRQSGDQAFHLPPAAEMKDIASFPAPFCPGRCLTPRIGAIISHKRGGMINTGAICNEKRLHA